MGLTTPLPYKHLGFKEHIGWASAWLWELNEILWPKEGIRPRKQSSHHSPPGEKEVTFLCLKSLVTERGPPTQEPKQRPGNSGVPAPRAPGLTLPLPSPHAPELLDQIQGWGWEGWPIHDPREPTEPLTSKRFCDHLQTPQLRKATTSVTTSFVQFVQCFPHN